MARSIFAGSASAGCQSSTVCRALLLSTLLPILGAAAEEDRSDREAFTQGQLTESWRTPTRLNIVWIDPTRALPFSSTFVALEVREVFATLGVAVDWSEAGSEPIEDPEALRVILLRAEPSGWRFERNVLGIVNRNPASDRAIWVVLSNVRKALGLHPIGSPGSATDHFRLARALGRVTVHEVFHVVAPWHAHADEGLMRETLDQRALLRPSVNLDLESREVFLSVLAARQPGRLARGPQTGRGLTRLRTGGNREPNPATWLLRRPGPLSAGPPQ